MQEPSVMPEQVTGEKAKPPGRIRVSVWGLGCFSLGVSASAAYLLLGGDYFWNIPLYARVLFYPGFVAGYRAFNWGISESVSKMVGVMAVGVVYGLLAMILSFAFKLDATLRKSDV